MKVNCPNQYFTASNDSAMPKQSKANDAVVDLILKIPAKDMGKMEWVKSQHPEIISELLSLVEGLYKSMEHGSQIKDMNEYKEKLFSDSEQKLNAQLTEMEHKHQTNLSKMKEAEQQHYSALLDVERRKVAMLEHQQNQHEEEMRHSAEKLKNVLNMEFKTCLEVEHRRCATLQEENNRMKASYEEKLNAQTMEINKLQQSAKDMEHEFSEKYANDSKMARQEVVDIMNQQQLLSERHATEVQAKDKKIKEIEDSKDRAYREMEERKDKAYKEMEEKKDNQYKMLEDKKDLMWQANEERWQTMSDEFQKSMRKMTGNNTVVGEFGESFFETTFDDLNIDQVFGKLTKTKEMGYKNQGYMDYDWDCPLSGCYPIRASLDVKHSSLEGKNDYIKSEDINKFHEDTERSVELDRRNLTILIGLTRYVKNKSRFSIEWYKGIPVIYASRHPDDNVSARELIEITLRVVKGIWHLLCSKTAQAQSYEDLSSSVINFVNNQVANMNNHGEIIKSMEKLANQAFTNANNQVKNLVKLNQTYDDMKTSLSTLSERFHGLSQDHNVQQEEKRDFMTKHKEIIKEVYLKWLDSKKHLSSRRYNAKVKDLLNVHSLNDEIVAKLETDPTILDSIGKELKADSGILQKRKRADEEECSET